jgi:hypothetical protein
MIFAYHKFERNEAGVCGVTDQNGKLCGYLSCEHITEAFLGLATTKELIEELRARGLMGDVPAMVDHCETMLRHLPHKVLNHLTYDI